MLLLKILSVVVKAQMGGFEPPNTKKLLKIFFKIDQKHLTNKTKYGII